MLNHPAFLLAAAFVLDLLLGDPPCPVHPVRLIGRLIGIAERLLRRCRIQLLLAGALLPCIVGGAALLVYQLLRHLAPGAEWLINLLLIYSLLALKDLAHHARRVAAALHSDDLTAARAAVQTIVGRDVNRLDPAGIARATIESVAENFVDGFLSPVFWFAAGALCFGGAGGGVALLLLFKVVSTLDSMVGYKNERYLLFGRVSAKLDDAMNFVPARLSIPLLALAARCAGGDWKAAWRIGWRDRLKHASPNSAHAEAAAAGALNLQLGGPTVYPHGTVDKPWLGDGVRDTTAGDIRRTLNLVYAAAWIGVLAAGALLCINFKH